MDKFSLSLDARRVLYTKDIASFCNKFSCNNSDLDDFFAEDSLLYEKELLGKTYAWINVDNVREIVAMVTLSNDSVKLKNISNAARNRIQRGIVNAKRGINYPAVLIGRLGVSSDYQGRGLKIGSQILNFLKDWFRSISNKTGCRFLLVDAYNNLNTLLFYEKNGFKFLYSTEEDERKFLNISGEKNLDTRFMYFDLKLK